MPLPCRGNWTLNLLDSIFHSKWFPSTNGMNKLQDLERFSCLQNGNIFSTSEIGRSMYKTIEKLGEKENGWDQVKKKYIYLIKFSVLQAVKNQVKARNDFLKRKLTMEGVHSFLNIFLGKQKRASRQDIWDGSRQDKYMHFIAFCSLQKTYLRDAWRTREIYFRLEIFKKGECFRFISKKKSYFIFLFLFFKLSCSDRCV